MGLFKTIINIFSSAIKCPDKYANELMYVANLKRNKIRVGTTLFVRKNFIAVLATKGKVTDVFIEGKHKLTPGAMPLTTKKVKFDKKNKKKKPKEKFKAEVYFINTQEFTRSFVGIQPFIIKDKHLGKTKVRANGEFTFSVLNAKTFIEVCLLKWAYVKPKVVEKQLSYWVSDEVIKNLAKLNLPLIEFAKNNPYISDRILKPIKSKFESLGLDIQKVKITETFIPNKMAVSLKEKKDNNNEESLLVNDDKNETSYIREQSTNNKINEENPDQVNFYTSEYEKQLMASKNSNSNNEPHSNYENTYNKQQASSSNVLVEEEFSTRNKLETKNCFNCGKQIAKEAVACYNCGAKQTSKRLCPNCNAQVDEGEFVCPSCKGIIV